MPLQIELINSNTSIMKTITHLIKIMFALFILLQIISFSHLYGSPGNRYKHVDSYLTMLEQNNRSMLSVTMVGGDSNPYQRSIGYINIQSKQFSNSNTCYRIGGVSKLFTSIVIMQMVDEKMIQLGTPLSRFYPELPYAKNITIEDLLAENIMIVDYLPGGKFYSHFQNGRNFKSTLNEDLKPLVYSSGGYEGISPNYILLGLIIEQLTKKSFHEIVTERVILKAGLQNTFDCSSEILSDQTAVAYTLKSNNMVEEGSWDLLSVKGSSSIYSTPSDLVHLISLLFNGKMVSEKSLHNMMLMRNYSGLGMRELNVQGKQAYGYKSTFDGFVNEWVYIPQDSLAIAFSMNLDDARSGIMMQDLIMAYYKSQAS